VATYREGGRVTIGDREFIVPKATLAVARAVAGLQQEAVTSPEVDGYLASARVLQLLLVKAAPGLTVDELLDLVLVDEIRKVLDDVQAAAGFVRTTPGEAARP
jgi:hypothetical protein